MIISGYTGSVAHGTHLVVNYTIFGHLLSVTNFTKIYVGHLIEHHQANDLFLVCSASTKVIG